MLSHGNYNHSHNFFFISLSIFLLNLLLSFLSYLSIYLSINLSFLLSYLMLSFILYPSLPLLRPGDGSVSYIYLLFHFCISVNKTFIRDFFFHSQIFVNFIYLLRDLG